MASSTVEGSRRSQRSRGGRGSQGKGKGRGELQNGGQHASNGASQPRRGGSVGSGRIPQHLGAGPLAAAGSREEDLSEADLKQRLEAAQAAETALRADEHRLRQDLAAAEQARGRGRRQEERAREAVEEGRKRASRSVEFLRGELAELMQLVLGHEQAEKEHTLKETAWQAELDSIVLAQARTMTQRDELTAEVARLEEQARAHEMRANKVESRARHVEERCKKERERVDMVRREAEEVKREVDGERVSQKRAEEELLRHQEEGKLGITIWRSVTVILVVLAVFATIYRAAGP